MPQYHIHGYFDVDLALYWDPSDSPSAIVPEQQIRFFVYIYDRHSQFKSCSGNFDILILVVNIVILVFAGGRATNPSWTLGIIGVSHYSVILVFYPGRCLTIATLVPQTY